jgi:long-chain acyl-CoA synthetase
MILGPSGQNIYPEQIESKLNNMIYIQESVIIERDNKLIAIVNPDFNLMEKDGFKTDNLDEFMEEYRKALNSQIPAYMAIARIQIYNKEFEKTPKKNIKRYLYT